MARTHSATRQILAVRRALSALDRSLRRLTASLNGAGALATSGRRPPRKLTAKARANLKLQGRYMGYVRQLKPRQKAEVRALKERKGFEAAIRKARQLPRP